MVRKTISTTGPRQDETDETRQAILQAAARLFFEYGYRAVTTRRIALACGLTQPALYHHFADKQDLYVAVITGELRRMKTILDHQSVADIEPETKGRQQRIVYLHRAGG